MIRTEVKLGWKSIPGHRHLSEGRENEDAVLASGEHPLFDALMIVSDGMGGHPEPRLAAQTAAAAARDFLADPRRQSELAGRRVDAAQLLRAAVQHANERVRRLAARVSSGGGDDKPPGCTLSVAAVAEGRLLVALVGDGSAFLLREARLRPLAGGEARRFGSRPEEFLGRSDQIEVELVMEEAREGDRLLLCTDGLTRYFGIGAAAASGGLERLQQVIARPSADPQALASQLTADGRGEQYEDDTTVIVAEVGASREVADPQPREATRWEEERARGQRGDSREMSPGSAGSAPRPIGASPAPSPARPLARAASLLFAVLLVALGFAGGRAWRGADRDPAPRYEPPAAPTVDLSGLPRGGVLLVHPDSGRLFALRTRPLPAPASDGPLTLRALRMTPQGQVRDTGSNYRLDSARGLLSAPGGAVYPVTIDSATGVIAIQPAGKLHLITRPAGLRVYVDGHLAGKTPLATTVRAGAHQVEFRSASGRELLSQAPVEVPPGWSVTVNATPPTPGPVSRP